MVGSESEGGKMTVHHNGDHNLDSSGKIWHDATTENVTLGNVTHGTIKMGI